MILPTIMFTRASVGNRSCSKCAVMIVLVVQRPFWIMRIYWCLLLDKDKIILFYFIFKRVGVFFFWVKLIY